MNEEKILLAEIDSTIMPKMKPITLYPAIPVEMTYQNFGSAWLCVLRGSTDNIELVYNGLYNFGGTNGKVPDYRDGSKTLAVFWSSYKMLRKFFFNQYYIPRFNLEKKIDMQTIRAGMKLALSRIKELQSQSHEPFVNKEAYDVYEHSIGQKHAERPDTDFKDSVLLHSFQDKTHDKKTCLTEFNEKS